MSDTIRKMYNGTIFVQEEVPENREEYQECVKEMCEYQEILLKSLDEKNAEIFEKFLDKRNSYSCIICEDAFVKGFKLGTKIIIESLEN